MREDRLYAIAMQCAELNANGCARDCVNCMYNIHNYVDDVREASLLKANAYSDYHRQHKIIQDIKDKQTAWDMAGPVAIIIMVLVCMWACHSVKSCFTPSKAYVPQETEYIMVNASFNEDIPARIIHINGEVNKNEYTGK